MSTGPSFEGYLAACEAAGAEQWDQVIGPAVQQALEGSGITVPALDSALRAQLPERADAAGWFDAGLPDLAEEVAEVALGGPVLEEHFLPEGAGKRYVASLLPWLQERISRHPQPALLAAGIRAVLVRWGRQLEQEAEGAREELAGRRKVRDQYLVVMADGQRGLSTTIRGWLVGLPDRIEAAAKLRIVNRHLGQLAPELAVQQATLDGLRVALGAADDLLRAYHRLTLLLPGLRHEVAGRRTLWEREGDETVRTAPWPVGPAQAEALAAPRLPAPQAPPDLLTAAVEGVQAAGVAPLLLQEAAHQVAGGAPMPGILDVLEGVAAAEQQEGRVAGDWPVTAQTNLLQRVWDRGSHRLAKGADPRVVLVRVGPSDNPAVFPDGAGVLDVALPSGDRVDLLRLESGLSLEDLAVYREHREAFARERQRRHFGLVVPPRPGRSDSLSGPVGGGPAPVQPPASDSPAPPAEEGITPTGGEGVASTPGQRNGPAPATSLQTTAPLPPLAV